MKIYTKMRSLLYGWGINDADYIIRRRVDGKCVICPYYIRWISVVQRGNDPKEKARKPAYDHVYVSEEWRYFSKFKAWLEVQPYWQELAIDKDILVKGNQEYGPSTCVLVPTYLNKAVVVSGPNTGKYPRGVGRNAKGIKYNARFCNLSLGSYLTPLEAHQAWQTAKANAMEEAIKQYSTEKWARADVIEAITIRIDKLRLDCLMGVETSDV